MKTNKSCPVYVGEDEEDLASAPLPSSTNPKGRRNLDELEESFVEDDVEYDSNVEEEEEVPPLSSPLRSG